MHLYLRLLAYARPYLPRMIVAMLCTALASLANLCIPKIVGGVIDDVLMAKDLTMLNLIAVGIVVLFLLRGLCFYGQTYLLSYVGQKVIIDIRETLYRHLQQLSLLYFENRRTGAVMSYVTNDVAVLQSALVDNVIELVTEGVILVGSIVWMLYIDWKLSLLTFITLPLVGQTINVFGKKLRDASRVIQERAASITSVLQESILSVRVIQSFVREDYEAERFDRENYRNFHAQLKAVRLTAILTPAIEFLGALGVTAIIWYGGKEVINGNLTSGDLIAFLQFG